MSAVGDARKRQERKQRQAPLGVGQDGDLWAAVCDGSCKDPIDMLTNSWNDAYESALGHACLHHGSRR